jgi:hypothetical protein
MRLLARAEDPKGVAPELYWINARVRLMGESHGMARRSIEARIKNGSMIVVDDVKTEEKP